MQIAHGNLLDVARGLIVHSCNCQGKMGTGVALAIRNKWPKVYNAYVAEYHRGALKLGRIGAIWVAHELVVVNAMTQDRYGRDKRYTDYDAVYECFEKINRLALVDHLPVHFPKMGCANAGGDWGIVSAIIEDVLDPSLERTLWVLP